MNVILAIQYSIPSDIVIMLVQLYQSLSSASLMHVLITLEVRHYNTYMLDLGTARLIVSGSLCSSSLIAHKLQETWQLFVKIVVLSGKVVVLGGLSMPVPPYAIPPFVFLN